MATTPGGNVPVPPSASDHSGSHAFVGEVEEDDDDFDVEAFREWMRNRRASTRRRRDDDEESRDGGGDDHRSSSGPPPEWDGESISFQDYAIKARLWLATTKSKPRTRGPLLLQKLSKVPFETMKHLAKDQQWMRSDTNGEELIEEMDRPENFGDDSEEDLLSALAKVTYHLRRGKEEQHRAFFNKWEQAMRKVREHRVVLPDKYVGFLMINALNLGETEIKALLNYTRGSITPPDIKEWVRKHETKLQVSQVGIEKKPGTRAAAVNYVSDEPYDQSDEEEIHAIESALRDLQDGEDGDSQATSDQQVLEEHEAAEILNTFLQNRKTYSQTIKAKKQKELSRGYGNFNKGYKMSFIGKGKPPFKGGKYQMSVEELKKVTKCGICHQVGHWHRECPNPKSKDSKEAHNLETEEAIFCGHLDYDQSQGDRRDLPPGQEELSGRDTEPRDTSEHHSGKGSMPDDLSFSKYSVGDSVSSAERAYMASLHDLHEVFYGERLKESVSKPPNSLDDTTCATIDTGCQRMAIGRKTLERLAQHVPNQVPVQTHEQEHRFKSVHGSSSTQFVASIPTSIGDKGAFLKPAVFDNIESVNAPFLISLPFLLACRTTLELDPETGLTATFKKLGFSVDCHLGPTGALRIPLCKFTRKQMKHLKAVQQQMEKQEFEVLRMDSQEKDSSHCSPPVHDSLAQPDSSHGAQPQESPGAVQLSRTSDVGHCRQQDSLCDPEDGKPSIPPISTSCPTARPTSSPTTRTDESPEPNIYGGEQPSQQPGRATNEPGLMGHGDIRHIGGKEGTDTDHTRDSADDGKTSNVPTPKTNKTLCELHGKELPSTLLAMSGSTTVPVLHVDRSSTSGSSGLRGVQGVPEDEDRKSIVLQPSGHTPDDAEPTAVHLQTPEDLQERYQCLQGDREVHRLRNDPERDEDQVGNGKGPEEGRNPRTKEPKGHGVQDHPDTRTGSSDQSFGSPRSWRSVDGPKRDAVSEPSCPTVTPLGRKEKRILRQAISALSETAETLENLMTCLQSPDVTAKGVFEHLACTLGTGPNHWGPRKTCRLARVFGISKSQVRTVAEVYNPKRFTPQGKKFGLEEGQSFDVTLGHDLLNEKVRRTVRQYIRQCKPGLVCVSPPCTLHSLLQNLNQIYRDKHPDKQLEFNRRLVESTVLLHFGMEVCEMVRAYGGTFLFEHPRTSKAWQDQLVQQLQDHTDVIKINNDQCSFGLRSTDGGLHKKPTSWLTNSTYIAKALDKPCTGDHEHQQTIGSHKGKSRAALAAKYPERLVRAVLKAYAQSLEEPTEIYHFDMEDLISECLSMDQLWSELETKDISDTAEVLAVDQTNDNSAIADIINAPTDDEGEAEREGELQEAEQSHRPLPLERPMSLESLVRRAHNGMGHVSNLRLAGILKKANASDEAIKIAKNLKCPTCEHHKHVDGARKAAPPRNYKPNQLVGVDTVWLPGIEPNGKRKMALNCICWSTRFQLMIPLSGHTPGEAVRGFYQWIRIFGPPERIYCDMGREFISKFQTMADNNDIYLDPGAIEAPTQRSITERSGRTFKEILSKTVMATGVTTWEEWHEAVSVVNATVNRLTNKSGFSPCQRMLGFNPRLPGSLLSGGHDDYGVLSKLDNGDLQMQRSMNLRREAAKAYHDADCNQALRHAVHSAPKKLYDYQPGQMVYFWRKAQEKAKKNNSDFWIGPAKVILTDMPSTVWLSYQNKLVRACPEHLRPASEEEKFAITDFIADIVETKKMIQNDQIRNFIILDEKETPPEGPQPLGDRDALEEEEARGEQEEGIRQPEEAPRFPQFKQVEPKYRLRGKWDPENIVPREEPEAKRKKPNEPEEDVLLRQAEEPEDDIYSPSVAATEDLHPEGKENKSEEIIDISGSSEEEEEHRGQVRQAEEDQAQEDQPPSKRMRTEWIEIMLTQVLAVSPKKRKELQMNQVTNDNKEKFRKAMQKEIDTNMKSGAYSILGREESEKIRRDKPEKILKSRYVFTEKPLEQQDVEKATKEGILLESADLPGPHKAKARHVMKGFSEVGAEDLDSTTPQVAKESAFFVLQIITSLRWELGHLDFTQAFHSGDRIERELYAELPTEGVPGVHQRQLLKLNKTCYGLTDGPYAWYQHVSRILKELGYQKSRADPCLFYLFNDKEEIEGIIGLATDDMIHGGGKRHWRNMNWLKSSYQMGKFTTGSGTFTGKQIQVNNDGSMTVHQKNYIENNIQPIPIDRDRKVRKYNRCTEEEKGQLRTLIGGLSWVSKECRPDIAGRVALLQQTMPTPMVKDMIEGNSILEDIEKTSDIGIKIQPIEITKLRVGVVTDASWGNAGPNVQETVKGDYWEETDDAWTRHHTQERTITFHPGSTPDGPDLHSISRQRITIANEQQIVDKWDGEDGIQDTKTKWRGKTIFLKTNNKTETNRPMSERFLQLCKQSSQGGYILFYYDSSIETSDRPEMITIAGWKSYKLKRCTVNTLSAECQSMLEGIGNIHWHRFLLAESAGRKLDLHDWELQLGDWPFIAITDSKSLYDTVTKCRNSSSHISDKRTAIDLTILKSDLSQTKGQVRWVGGTNMISDALTKKMSPLFLRKIMKAGKWALTETGHSELCAQQAT